MDLLVLFVILGGILKTYEVLSLPVCQNSPPFIGHGAYNPDPNHVFQFDPVPRDCENSQIGDVCQPCCYSGYTPNQPTCVRNGQQAEWHPENRVCEPDAAENCVIHQFNGLQMIRVEDCDQNLIFGVIYNPQERITQVSLLHYEAKNQLSIFDDINVGKHWRTYQCDAIRNFQLDDAFYAGLEGMDKGHFCAFADTQYSYAAIRASYTYINAFPQIVHSNRGSWRAVERIGRRGDLLNDYQIFHMTGVHAIVNSVPRYIYKIYCFSSEANTFVFGYYTENTQFENPNDNDEKHERLWSLFTPRSVAFFLNELNVDILQYMRESQRFFRDLDATNAFRRCSEPTDFDSDATTQFISTQGFTEYNVFATYHDIKSGEVNAQDFDYDHAFESDDGEP